MLDIEFLKPKRGFLPKGLLILVFIWSGTSLFAQQDAQYTQYMYNTVSVNPGYAGSRGQISIAALHRSQWLGLEGAPTTQTFNIHSPIGYEGVGMGLSIVNDQIGPTSETNFDVDFRPTFEPLFIITRKNSTLDFPFPEFWKPPILRSHP